MKNLTVVVAFATAIFLGISMLLGFYFGWKALIAGVLISIAIISGLIWAVKDLIVLTQKKEQGQLLEREQELERLQKGEEIEMPNPWIKILWKMAVVLAGLEIVLLIFLRNGFVEIFIGLAIVCMISASRKLRRGMEIKKIFSIWRMWYIYAGLVGLLLALIIQGGS